MSGSIWPSIIILTTFLALIVRGYTWRNIPARRSFAMALIWLAIFLALAAVFSQFPL